MGAIQRYAKRASVKLRHYLTVGELLAGNRIDMPPVRQTSVTFKRAPKAAMKAAEQPSIFGTDEPESN